MSDAWQWWASRDGESYSVGPEDSRESAIRAATDDFGGEPFWIIEAVQDTADGLMPGAQTIIERRLEDLADDGVFGDDGDFGLSGGREVHKEAYAELDAHLKSWFGKWKRLFPIPWRFAASRNEELITPEKPADAEAQP